MWFEGRGGYGIAALGWTKYFRCRNIHKFRLKDSFKLKQAEGEGLNPLYMHEFILKDSFKLQQVEGLNSSF